MLDLLERSVRWAGLGVAVVCWAAAGWGAVRGASRAPGRATGLAQRYRAHLVYSLGAIPYFAICALLWRSLPVTLSATGRIAALAIGTVLGAAGATFYLWGRWTLGDMYNISSSLGTELYAGQRLVAAGPYSLVRHPMYLGLFAAAAGGLLVYRTWTLVFMLATLPGAVVKARHEERLLAADLGGEWAAYARAVPAWIPRLRRRRPAAQPVEVNHDTRDPAPA